MKCDPLTSCVPAKLTAWPDILLEVGEIFKTMSNVGHPIMILSFGMVYTRYTYHPFMEFSGMGF